MVNDGPMLSSHLFDLFLMQNMSIPIKSEMGKPILNKSRVMEISNLGSKTHVYCFQGRHHIPEYVSNLF